MSSDIQQALDETIRFAANGRHRLLLVIGEAASGKTTFLRGIATERAMQFLSLGEPLGVRLMEITPRTRPLIIEETVRELLDGTRPGVCIDNTDILFDPALRCDPMRLACNVSQNIFVAYSLTGRIEGKRFVHGHPDHPEFYSEELPSVPIITLDRSGPSFLANP